MTTTLALVLRSREFKVQAHDGFLEATHEEEDFYSVPKEFRSAETHAIVPRDAALFREASSVPH